MKSISLKSKIMLSVTITCIAAVLVTTYVTVMSGLATTKDTIINDSHNLALVIGQSNVGAISFGDAETVTSSLNALSLSKRVLGAAIYAQGKLLACYGKDISAQNAKKIFPISHVSLGLVENKKRLEITETIKSEGAQVGVITMYVDLSEVDEIVNVSVRRSMIVVIVLSVLALSAAYAVQKSIVTPISRVLDALKNISEGEGDLTQRIPVYGSDEVAALAFSFNSFVERLRIIISHVVQTADLVRKDAEHLSSISKQNETEIINQQLDIQQIVAAITEMASVVESVSQSVSETANQSLQADSAASKGNETVLATMSQIKNLSTEIHNATSVIDQLQTETLSIGSVLDVIKGIAEQTNLLALNAAIEAARAGEQGRGFAVVADEVRTLASRTQASTKEIREMIERLQNGSRKAVDMMSAGTVQVATSVHQASEASASLADITNMVCVIRDRTNQIAAATEQQSAATRQIEKNIDQISIVSKNSAKNSSEISANTRHLVETALEMSNLVGRFKI